MKISEEACSEIAIHGGAYFESELRVDEHPECVGFWVKDGRPYLTARELCEAEGWI